MPTSTCFRLFVAGCILLTACSRTIDANVKNQDINVKRGKPGTGGGGGGTTANNNPDGVCNYQTADLSGWTKVFEDNFSSSDFSSWNLWNSGSYNNELEHYQPSNATISNGTLKIEVKEETVTGNTDPWNTTQKTFDYTSARLESKALYSANNSSPKVRMSARIKLPSGYGMWPAWWSYGDPWPTQGEIDILEARGQEPYKFQTNYFYGKAANRNLVKNAEGYITSKTSLVDCFHVYELVWEKSSLSFYFDSELVDVKTGGYVSSLFGKQEKLVLNVAVGGVFFYNLDPSLITPGTMEVDWVKVYTSN